jgi:hypothetical protein
MEQVQPPLTAHFERCVANQEFGEILAFVNQVTLQLMQD